MSNERSYLGFPLKIVSNAELRDAVMHGEFIHRGCGMAAYRIGDRIFIVEADKPISVVG